MYYLRDKITSLPYFKFFQVKKYYMRVVAEKEKEKANETVKSERVDVVEISKSARLYLENQRRMQVDHHPSTDSTDSK
jgi:hypothetical protein